MAQKDTGDGHASLETWVWSLTFVKAEGENRLHKGVPWPPSALSNMHDSPVKINKSFKTNDKHIDVKVKFLLVNKMSNYEPHDNFVSFHTFQ